MYDTFSFSAFLLNVDDIAVHTIQKQLFVASVIQDRDFYYFSCRHVKIPMLREGRRSAAS